MDNGSNSFPSKDDIERITTYKEGCEILKRLGIKLEPVEDLDDVKEVLTLKYHRKDHNEEIKKTGLYEDYPKLMKKFEDLLKKMELFKNSDPFQKEFREIFKRKENKITTIVKPLREMIQCQKFPILIAGEAKAGKSTFINLLINKDLMPTGLEVCSRMICEIQNSTERNVKFTGPNEEYANFGIDDLTKIKNMIKRKREEGYVVANVKYPVNFLENYIYLVDSPGIGDTLILENMTLDYLNRTTPALIFVLNSQNSYGLDIKARELISKSKSMFLNAKHLTSNTKSSNEHIFQFEKALFILNQFDMIKNEISSESELEEFKDKIVRDIKHIWHEKIDVKRQIFFISAKKACEWQKEGIVQEVVTDIRNCIRRLIVYIYERNLQFSIKELNSLCSKFEKKILVKLNNRVDFEYCHQIDWNNDKMACENLEKALTNMKIIKNRVMSEIKPKFNMMAEDLTKYLKSDDVEKGIIDSYQSQIDPRLKDIHILLIIFKKHFETRLIDEITMWEREKKQMEKFYIFLYASIERNLNEICKDFNISDNMLNKESFLNSWNEICEKENYKSADEFIDKIEKIFIFSTFTILFPIVALAGILATPLIISHIVQEKRLNENQMSAYTNNPETFLKSQSSNILKNLTPEIIRNSVFNNVEKKCLDLIDNFEKVIQNDITEKNMSIRSIEEERRKFPDLLNSLRELLNQAEIFCSKLEIIKTKYDSCIDSGLFVLPSIFEKVIAEETRITESLNTGEFSQLFKNENYKSVVFKTYMEKFDEHNAHFQMQEIDLLRKHPSDFMVRCQSALFLEKEKKIMIVLESVDCTLYSYIHDNPTLSPSYEKTNTEIQNAAIQFLLDVSIQISFALKYLFTYEPRMVHPDLTLNSILVRKTSEINKIKILLCDACCNLPIKVQTKDSNPQIFLMGGFTNENVFRLGLIFYQIVCFRTYCDNDQMTDSYDSNPSLLDSFYVVTVVNPSTIKWEGIESLVPTSYRYLIDKCVSQKPEDRPTIKDIINNLENIKKDFNPISNLCQAPLIFVDKVVDEI